MAAESVTRRVLILGSSGSIGTQAVEIVTARADLETVGVAVGRDWRTAVTQARSMGLETIAVADPQAASEARENFDGNVLEGPDSAVEMIGLTRPDIVLNGIVGAAGLGPTVAALTGGIDVALANKESLVIGGELVTDPREIGPALDRAFASGIPYLVNVVTDVEAAYPRNTLGI